MAVVCDSELVRLAADESGAADETSGWIDSLKAVTTAPGATRHARIYSSSRGAVDQIVSRQIYPSDKIRWSVGSVGSSGCAFTCKEKRSGYEVNGAEE